MFGKAWRIEIGGVAGRRIRLEFKLTNGVKVWVLSEAIGDAGERASTYLTSGRVFAQTAEVCQKRELPKNPRCPWAIRLGSGLFPPRRSEPVPHEAGAEVRQ
jgi:hypothetical protein